MRHILHIPKEAKGPLGTVLPKRLTILSLVAWPTTLQNHRFSIHRMEAGTTLPLSGIQTPSHVILVLLPPTLQVMITGCIHHILAEVLLSYHLNSTSTFRMLHAAPLDRFVVVQVSLRKIHTLLRTSESIMEPIRHTQAALLTCLTSHHSLHKKLSRGTLPHNGLQTLSHRITVIPPLAPPLAPLPAPPTPTLPMITERIHHILEEVLIYLNRTSTPKMPQAAPLDRFVVVRVSLRKMQTMPVLRIHHIREEVPIYLNRTSTLKAPRATPLDRFTAVQVSLWKMQTLPVLRTHHIREEGPIYLNSTSTLRTPQVAPLDRFVVVQMSLRKMHALFRIHHTQAAPPPYLKIPSLHKNLPHGCRKPLARFVVTPASLRKVENIFPTPQWVPRPHTSPRPRPQRHTIS